MSPECKNKKDCHREKSTRANTVKVITFNKVWDEWHCGIVVDKLANLILHYINTTPVVMKDGRRYSIEVPVRRYFSRSKGAEATGIRKSWWKGGVDGIRYI